MISRNEIVVASCADDNYALSLSVTLKSIMLSLSPDHDIRFFVLDGGISSEKKNKIQQTVGLEKNAVTWVNLPLSKFMHFPKAQYFKRIVYARLFLPSILRREEKVIWLDSDTVVLRDLSELWKVNIDEYSVGAIQDSYLLTFKRGLSKIYQSLGAPGELPYFNAGVMIMNLNKLRKDCFEEKAMRFVRRYQRLMSWCDQDVLNAILSKSWKKIDPRWNRIESIFCPSDQKEYADLSKDLQDKAYILHYAGSVKPWFYGSRAATRGVFFKILDQTPWSQWRPKMPWRMKVKHKLSVLIALHKSLRGAWRMWFKKNQRCSL